MKRIYRNVQPASVSNALAKLAAHTIARRSDALVQRRGGKMVVYANDAIGHAINAAGFYELTELEATCHIPDDHKAFDGTARGWI